MDPEMLRAMASDPSAMQQRLQQLLAERVGSDPRMSMLMQLLSNRSQPSPQSTERPQGTTAAARVRARVAEMRAELVRLRQRNEALAAALGACEACWGDQPSCPTCAGAGGPGWRMPLLSSFEALVAPAIARLVPHEGTTDDANATVIDIE